MFPFTWNIHKNRSGRLCSFLHFRVGWFFLWHISGKLWRPFSSFIYFMYIVHTYKYTFCIQCVGSCEMKKASPQTYQCGTASFSSQMYLACNHHGLKLVFQMSHSTCIAFCLRISVWFLPPQAVLSVFHVLGVFWNMSNLTANTHALFLIIIHLNLNCAFLCASGMVLPWLF